MNKELPKIFKNKTNKIFTNNNDIYYGELQDRKKKVTVDDLFQTNEIYRTKVKITYNNSTVFKTIIGKTQNNLITLDNEIIPISNIIEIEEI